MNTLILLFIACLTGVSTPKPNIVILFVDDAGYTDFGFTGTQDFRTPRIDKLASEGVVCTNGYVTASVCSPSRAGLMTGRYQQRFGHEANLRGKDVGLPLEELTIADYLKPLGYTSCLIGKWHLGGTEQMHPLSRGFDEFHGFLLGSRTYWSKKNPDKVTQQSLLNGTTVIPEKEDRYLTDWITEQANDFIHKQQDNPFFLFVSFNAVHTPMEAPNQLIAQFPEIKNKKRQKLAAMTLSLDNAVGSILDNLKELNLDENTIIFFLNDNGGATINASDNGPLRGMKGSKWEGGIRVPYVVKWMNHLTPSEYEHPVSTLDIASTVIAVAGGDKQEKLDGINLMPFLDGTNLEKPHEALYWRRGPAGAVRYGDWKLIRVDDQPPLLFNLEQDLGETTNLAPHYPQQVNHILSLYDEWEEGLTEPLWISEKIWRDRQVAKHKMDVIGRDAERKIP